MNSIHNNTDPSSSGLAEGNGQEELDFPYLFIYNQPCDEYPQDETAGDAGIAPHYDVLHPFPGGQHGSPHLFSSGGGALEYEAVDLRELLGGQGRSLSPQPWGGPPPPPAPPPPPPSASPRIEITCSEKHHQHRDLVPTAPVDIDRRPTLTVPGYELMAYREACLSPASSNSSTSWQSDICSPLASPCVSLGNGGSPRTSPTGSPCAGVAEDAYPGRRASLTSSSSRPGSRSTSPQGKRTYAMYENPGLARPRSRSPSPHFAYEHQTALPQDDELYGARSRLEELANTPGYVQAKAVPTKMVRPNQEYAIYRQSQAQHSGFLCDLEVKREAGLETLYVVQPQLLPGICSLPPTSLPPLDKPLPSRTEQYELCVEVQPRAHHRAHYETEGSRGAVKAHSGGHPVVQLRGYSGTDPLGLQVFIGTSDDRPMRPHAFYQVHRITGKTVSTRSQERMLYGTKVLELPLEPKENMRAVIDCAGILKLKNADIELRKGETHVGRKNTRVRMVFRVHVPKGGGHFLSLQVDSQPIECSQRSAHELPAVERQDVECCSVLGGIQMILTGQNFTSDSRVVFTEKTHVGQQIWEAEATVDRDKSQASMLFVEVPPYRDPKIYHPVKVNFHVRNSKGKRSQPQHFTYTPLSVSLIKAEPFDEFQFGQLGCAVSQILGVSPQPCRHANQTAYGGACASSDGPASLVIYPPAVQYQLQYPPGHYASHAHGLAASPPLGPYQPLAEHAMPGVSAGTEQQRPAPTPLARPHFGPSSYRPQGGPHLAEQRHVFAGDSYKAAASQFLTLDMSDLSPNGALQRGAAGIGRVRPGHGGGPHQTGPEPDRQGTVPTRVTIKQESLDQEYLDDVNDIISNDLVVHEDDQ